MFHFSRVFFILISKNYLYHRFYIGKSSYVHKTDAHIPRLLYCTLFFNVGKFILFRVQRIAEKKIAPKTFNVAMLKQKVFVVDIYDIYAIEVYHKVKIIVWVLKFFGAIFFRDKSSTLIIINEQYVTVFLFSTF